MDFRIELQAVTELSDAELAWAVIKPLWNALDEPPSSKQSQQLLSTATEGQRLLYAVDWWQKEVRNGGFEQFFKNSAGVLTKEAMQGLHEIGATAYATLLERAISIFPGSEVPTSKSARAKALQAVPKADRGVLFSSLEDDFYDLLANPETNLERLRASYVRTNPEHFFLGHDA